MPTPAPRDLVTLTPVPAASERCERTVFGRSRAAAAAPPCDLEADRAVGVGAAAPAAAAGGRRHHAHQVAPPARSGESAGAAGAADQAIRRGDHPPFSEPS